MDGSVARQRGETPPPASSPNSTVDPSQVNVALWKKSTAGLCTRATVVGMTGSLMSQNWPSAMHAPAARSIPVKTPSPRTCSTER